MDLLFKSSDEFAVGGYEGCVSFGFRDDGLLDGERRKGDRVGGK